MALHRLAMLMAFAPLLLFSSAERASTAPPVRLEAEALTGDADVTVAGQVAAASQATVQRDDRVYPFYMPMQGLRPPAVIMRVRCDASRAAGREVFDRPSAAAIEGRIEGGYEFVYEAYDGAGRPCVYPFAPSMPQIVGQTNGTQYIFRSSVPGVQVTFRTNDAWATINPRLFELGPQRIHFEMRDIALDFPGAGEAKGAVHLEVLDVTRPGLITAVIRRSTIFGGKNAIFVPGGETMVLIEDSIIRGNVGDSVDQEHGTYINGTLVTHVRNSTWYGQKGWIDVASGRQLKDKAYLRVYENVTVANLPGATVPSAMPLVDISAFGFTWSNNLQLKRVPPAQDVRDSLVDLRTEIVYGAPDHYPWNIMVDPGWRMPANPLGALDQVYLSVFQNTLVDSFRSEPHVFRLNMQGLGVEPGTPTVIGNEQTTRAQQRMVSLAFNTRGTLRRAYTNEGWTYSDPVLPPEMQWVKDRDAFIRHALGLIGR
ncbi:hypothetical protein [Blastomonas sp. CCH5-A3]|uniref:hypothetical protein n=1 Tax=Blastomonas sp. CCH5-A3 TaxID=1768761 RepID=UPI00082671C1|nr:hypothetical protein [Blastomonas sp. CCH5-A3]